MLTKGRLLAFVAAAVLAGCAEGARSGAHAGARLGLAASDAAEATAPAETMPTPVASSTTPTVDLAILPAPALAEARYHHTATRLADGSVLVFGGEAEASRELAAPERFDPVAGTWSPAGLGGPAPTARTRHAATLLPDGRVLITGGIAGERALARTEIYNPVTDRFDIVAPLSIARWGHTATLLPDGSVLVIGGHDDRRLPVAGCERYDPASGSFETLPVSLSVARAFHTATLLPDGRVLVAGGLTSQDGARVAVTAQAELLSAPGANGGGWEIVAALGLLRHGRAAHTATLVQAGDRDGLVLLTGGTGVDPDPAARDDAEIFDPARNQFETVEARMAVARSGHTATRLADGSVLIIGGATAPHPDLCPVTVGIERFVPDALGVTPAAPFGGLTANALFVQPLGPSGAPVGLPETAQGLTAHTAVLLADGRVLVAGGADCAFATPVAVARTAIATATPTR